MITGIFRLAYCLCLFLLIVSLSVCNASEAILSKPAFFPKETRNGRSSGGHTAPPGSIVQVLQENRLSAFVVWERQRAWVDRNHLWNNKTSLVPIESAQLGSDVVFQKPQPTGSPRSIEARKGSKVDVLERGPSLALVKYRDVCGWIPLSAVGSDVPFGKKITASTEGFPNLEIVSPAVHEFQTTPELVYEKLVPFEVMGRITSLRHYDVKPPKNGYHTESVSFADYNLAWGGLLEDRSIRSTQGQRRSSFRFNSQLPPGIDAYDYCHNFHIATDSEEMKTRVLAAQPQDFVTLTGSLVRIFGNPARFRNPISWTSSVAGQYCYVFLVEQMVNHGGKAPSTGVAGL
jgi:hypothetical protein